MTAQKSLSCSATYYQSDVSEDLVAATAWRPSNFAKIIIWSRLVTLNKVLRKPRVRAGRMQMFT